MKKTAKNNGKSVNSVNNSKNGNSESTPKTVAKKVKAEPVVASEKMLQYATNRAQRIVARYETACNYSVTKANTANIVNCIATGNTYNGITVDTLCTRYIAFIKELHNELPKELIGLLKKYGCDTIRANVNNTNLGVFIDSRANVNVQAIVRLVCRFNKDIADIIRNVRKEQKETQSKEN